MTAEEYFEKARFLWQNYVPSSGQAQTVQGELIRAIEKLRDEAQRNGNINFNQTCHVILVEYLKKHLAVKGSFDDETIMQIEADLIMLSDKDCPYLEDDVYDRITDRIVDWYMQNAEPIPHSQNADLYC